MSKDQKTIIIALGGSIVVPRQIQVNFLRKFRKLILRFLEKGYCFVIVVGGGNICREYQTAAHKITKVSDEDKDWIGVHATRLNAQLLRTIFKKEAYPVVLDNPFKRIDGKRYRLFVASGWKPGWSTDYDAILLAKRFKTDRMIVVSKIAYVHESDVAKNKHAKPVKEITWKEYCKLIGSKWTPGMKAPVDPIASRLASKLRMKVIVARGTDLKNLEKILEGKKFKGTTII